MKELVQNMMDGVILLHEKPKDYVQIGIDAEDYYRTKESENI